MKRHHYIYRITNIIKNKYYYGSRTTSKIKEVKPKDDIGIKYFSSSKDKDFLLDQKLNPKNYKYKVIKTFSTRKEALESEVYLHKRFNVKSHEQFYNKSNQTSSKFDTTGKRPGNASKIKYNIHNYLNNIVYYNLYISDIYKINQALLNTSKYRRLGRNNVSKQSLNYNFKLHMIGWYIRSLNIDDTNQRVNYTEPKGRIYKPISQSQKDKTKLTMSLKSEKEIKLINLSKGIKNIGRKMSNESKRKCSISKMGELNYKTKSIYIYDNYNCLQFISKISFKKFCKNNFLPYNALINTLKHNSFCYSSNRGFMEAKKYNNTKYIGWYARYEKNNI